MIDALPSIDLNGFYNRCQIEENDVYFVPLSFCKNYAKSKKTCFLTYIITYLQPQQLLGPLLQHLWKEKENWKIVKSL